MYPTRFSKLVNVKSETKSHVSTESKARLNRTSSNKKKQHFSQSHKEAVVLKQT